MGGAAWRETAGISGDAGGLKPRRSTRNTSLTLSGATIRAGPIRPMLPRLLLAVMLLAPFAEARERAVLIYPKERSWFRRIFYTSHQRELRARISARYE